jgi:polar amino acid transport system permease protein
MLESLREELPRFLTYYNAVFLLQGLLTTLLLSVVGVVGGLLLGAALALVRVTDGTLLRPLRLAALAYGETVRRLPFLVTLMLIFFGFRFLRLDLDAFLVSMVAVVLISASYLGETVRAGVGSVHRNQWDAARSMNMGTLAALRHVVLPQAWRVIVPPTFAYFLGLIKDTALASQISVLELTYAGKLLRTKGFSGALTYGTILVLYFALSYPLARVGAALEVRLAAARARRGQQVVR